MTTETPPLTPNDDPEVLYLNVVLNPDLDAAAADDLYENIIGTSFEIAAKSSAWDINYQGNDHITKALMRGTGPTRPATQQ